MNQPKKSDLQRALEAPYFGKEVVNRVSFLREDADFVTNAVLHPSTRFIFYENGNPLVNKSAIGGKLVVLTNGDDQLNTLEGPEFVPGTTSGLLSSNTFPHWRNTISTWAAENKEQTPEIRDLCKPSFLFLGLKDESVGLDMHHLKLYGMETYLDHQGRYFGIPYFGVDLTNAPKTTELIIEHIVGNSKGKILREDLIFTHSRKHTMGFDMEEAALFSHGKTYFDWLRRNRFCPECGLKVIGIHAGGKLKCTNEKKVKKFLKNIAKAGKEGENITRVDEIVEVYACPVRSARVSNVSFPRTDVVVITAITDREHTQMLLSLSKRHAHTQMYSATAGFIEPSETVEVAAKREIWEETGVTCADIQILMTQPWPFPGNLMIGCVATVDFNGQNEIIHLGHDRELADARWFDVSFVAKLIKGTAGSDENPENILLPSEVLVAHALIRHVITNGGTKL